MVLTFNYYPHHASFLPLQSIHFSVPTLSISLIPIDTFSVIFEASRSSPSSHTIFVFLQLFCPSIIVISGIPLPLLLFFTQVLNFLLLIPKFGLFICLVYARFTPFIFEVSPSLRLVLNYFIFIAQFVSFALIIFPFILSTFPSLCIILIVAFMSNLLTHN